MDCFRGGITLMRHDLRTGFQCKLSCKPLTTSQASEEGTWDWQKPYIHCLQFYFRSLVVYLMDHLCAVCDFSYKMCTHTQDCNRLNIAVVHVASCKLRGLVHTLKEQEMCSKSGHDQWYFCHFSLVLLWRVIKFKYVSAFLMCMQYIPPIRSWR